MKHAPQKKTHASAAVAVLAAAGLALSACDTGDTVPEPQMSTSTNPDADAADKDAENSATKPTGTEDGQQNTLGAADMQPGADGDFSTEPTEQFDGDPAELRTTDIRVGSHENYDRLVFEFEGTGQPRFHAGYTDDPRQHTSGNPVEVPGDAHFELLIHGTSLDMTPDHKYAGKTNLGLASGAVVDVVNQGTFEGASQYFVGLKDTRPYKVSILENPTRLVVDFEK